MDAQREFALDPNLDFFRKCQKTEPNCRCLMKHLKRQNSHNEHSLGVQSYQSLDIYIYTKEEYAETLWSSHRPIKDYQILSADMYSKVKHTPGIHDAKQPTSVCPPLTYPGLFELSKISLEFPLHLRVQAVTCCFQSQGWRLAAGSRFDAIQFIACLIHRVSWLEKSKYDKVLVHVFHLRINRRNPNEFHLHLHTRTCHIVRRGHFN